MAGLLERRYAVSILYASLHGATRFTEFRQALGEIPPRTLAQRLAELEQEGVFERIVHDSRPPLVEYRLTPEGKRLLTVVKALGAWAGSRTVR
jgi:DNA-binding HxlR family transcriptional regulator